MQDMAKNQWNQALTSYFGARMHDMAIRKSGRFNGTKHSPPIGTRIHGMAIRAIKMQCSMELVTYLLLESGCMDFRKSKQHSMESSTYCLLGARMRNMIIRVFKQYPMQSSTHNLFVARMHDMTIRKLSNIQ